MWLSSLTQKWQRDMCKCTRVTCQNNHPKTPAGTSKWKTLWWGGEIAGNNGLWQAEKNFTKGVKVVDVLGQCFGRNACQQKVVAFGLFWTSIKRLLSSLLSRCYINSTIGMQNSLSLSLVCLRKWFTFALLFLSLFVTRRAYSSKSADAAFFNLNLV